MQRCAVTTISKFQLVRFVRYDCFQGRGVAIEGCDVYWVTINGLSFVTVAGCVVVHNLRRERRCSQEEGLRGTIGPAWLQLGFVTPSVQERLDGCCKTRMIPALTKYERLVSRRSWSLHSDFYYDS
jgi:hypothetical protein